MRPSPGPSGPAIVVTSVGAAAGARAAAAALACVASEPDRAALLVDLAAGRPQRPTLLATVGARSLEERVVAHLPEARVASRGCLCQLTLPPDAGGVEQVVAALPLARESAAVVHLPPGLMRPLLESAARPTAALLRADLSDERELTALAAGDLIAQGLRVGVLKRPLGWLAGRAALIGALPASSRALPGRLRARLLEAD